MKLSKVEQESLQHQCEEFVRVEKNISQGYRFYFPEDSVSQSLFRGWYEVYAYFLNQNSTEHGEVKVQIYKDGRKPQITMFKMDRRN